MVLIYDLEVFPNYFLAGFLESKEMGYSYFFEISEWTDDSDDLLKLLSDKDLKLVGFNNLEYDYPLLDHILKKGLLNVHDPMMVTNMIYHKSQEIISNTFSSIPEWKIDIPQLDLMKVHHLDNKAKSATLKDIAFAIHFHNIEDIPASVHDYLFKDRDDKLRDNVRLYNMNDLLITKRFYERSKKEISLRRNLSKKYNLLLTNANDPKIGVEIFASKLAPRLGVNVWELKKMQTNRFMVSLNDCIFPYVNFKTPVFQTLLDNSMKVEVFEGETKGAWNETVIFGKLEYTFGLGGIHACIGPGIYEESNDYIIMTSDVTSYYPNLSIKNRFYPAHLTSIYCDVYEEIFNERKTYPQGTPENYGLKIALNGSFGKSNEQWSFFKDLKYFLRTTVNGQLLLVMLCERVAHLGQILMANTDGIEILIHKSKKQEYLNICTKWEKFTRLELEHGQYKKLIIRDVNNYRAVLHSDSVEGEDKVYEKGVFEIDKFLYKDHSMLVVPKALKAFYTDGTPVRTFIHNHKSIFDFYMRLKIKSNFTAEIRYVENENINIVQLSKTTRYYASTNGGYLYRINKDKTVKAPVSAIKKRQRCTIANLHVGAKIEDYNIDYLFYEQECYKIINAVDLKQFKMF